MPATNSEVLPPPAAAPAPPGAASPVTPARPRRRLPPEQRREMLRDAALAEFAAAGYAAASMDAVARRAGVAKGLLYHHFPGGKADLFDAVVRGVLRPLFDEAERDVAAAGDGPRLQLLRAILGRALDAAADPRARVVSRLIIAEGERFPELAEAYHAAVVRPGEALLAAVLREGVARGEFRAEAASWPVALLLAPAVLLSSWGLSFGEHHPLDAAALGRAQLELLLGGLLAGQGGGQGGGTGNGWRNDAA